MPSGIILGVWGYPMAAVGGQWCQRPPRRDQPRSMLGDLGAQLKQKWKLRVIFSMSHGRHIGTRIDPKPFQQSMQTSNVILVRLYSMDCRCRHGFNIEEKTRANATWNPKSWKRDFADICNENECCLRLGLNSTKQAFEKCRQTGQGTWH